MTLHSLHPIDVILAEVGMMARRARSDTLTVAEYVAIAGRIRRGVAEAGADPVGMIGALLDSLDLAADARTLARPQIAAVMDRVRQRLVRVRDGSLPVVPNFDVLPHGVHGRPRPVLTVFDGGLSSSSTHHERPL
jgi:hypothetical protein